MILRSSTKLFLFTALSTLGASRLCVCRRTCLPWPSRGARSLPLLRARPQPPSPGGTCSWARRWSRPPPDLLLSSGGRGRSRRPRKIRRGKSGHNWKKMRSSFAVAKKIRMNVANSELFLLFGFQMLRENTRDTGKKHQLLLLYKSSLCYEGDNNIN